MNVNGNPCNITSMLFADDTALFGMSEMEIQRLVDVFDTVCRRRNLKVNAKKSKVMVCEREGETECEIKMGEQVLEVVDRFKYLGSTVGKRGGVMEEVGERIKQGRRVTGVLKNIMRKKKLSKEVGVQMYESVVVPTLMYASETWAVTKEQLRSVKVVETNYLRAACGVTLRDRVRNKDLYERSGVKRDVVERVKGRTLEWFGHVERMSEERMVRRIYKGEVSGARRRGRPKRRWMECVGEYMRERGVSLDVGLCACGDRSEWRSFCAGHPLPGEWATND